MAKEERTKSFQRNENLERLLQELNDALEPANQQLVNTETSTETNLPIVFIFGAPRSGTTLFMQWLAATGICAYPSNLLSRFYQTPLIGAKIQQLLTDPLYTFQNELFDLQSSFDFTSIHGKTSSALSPNEFWYFWRRFGFGKSNNFVCNEELRRVLSNSSFPKELQSLAKSFGKPFALKAMIANQNIDTLNEVLARAIFIWIRREPKYNIQSLLEARCRQYGSLHDWYSFRIKEYSELVSLEPHLSVAGQVYYTNRAIENSFTSLPTEKKMTIDYEKFCEEPEHYYHSLQSLLAKQSAEHSDAYSGPLRFDASNQWRIHEYTLIEVQQAYESFLK